MIDYSKAYDEAYNEVKMAPFQCSNGSYDLREPYGWQPAIAHRRQRYFTRLLVNFSFALQIGLSKEEIIDVLNMDDKTYLSIYEIVKDYDKSMKSLRS